jgi:hypothetical protein
MQWAVHMEAWVSANFSNSILLCVSLISFDQGTMTDPVQPFIRIIKAGVKFPPHAYDPNTSPDTEIKINRRKNGQIHYSRRVIKPTVVLPHFTLQRIFNLRKCVLIHLPSRFLLTSS